MTNAEQLEQIKDLLRRIENLRRRNEEIALRRMYGEDWVNHKKERPVSRCLRAFRKRI